MDWLFQSSSALPGLAVTLVAAGLLFHVSFRSQPGSRIAFLTGLMKGVFEDHNPSAYSANPIAQPTLEPHSTHLL